MEDNYKNKVEKNQFETPKRYSVKNSDKTQGSEIIILSDSDKSDTKACNNDNDKLSNVTASISSRQLNLRNNDIKKDQHKHKSTTKKKK